MSINAQKAMPTIPNPIELDKPFTFCIMMTPIAACSTDWRKRGSGAGASISGAATTPPKTAKVLAAYGAPHLRQNASLSSARGASHSPQNPPGVVIAAPMAAYDRQ